jgi:hypothetical protein
VTTLRVCPVSALVTVTVAPGRTPPCASLTVPVMPPVVTVCAAAGCGQTSIAQTSAASAYALRDFSEQCIAIS